MKGGVHTRKLQQKWTALKWVQAVLLWLAFVLIILAFITDFNRQVLLVAFTGLLSVTVFTPWNINKQRVSQYLNRRFPEMQYSSELLESDVNDLDGLALVQYDRIHKIAQEDSRFAQPPVNLWPSLFFITLAAVAYGLFNGQPSISHTSLGDSQVLLPESDIGGPDPLLINHVFEIQPPAYTKIRPYSSSGPEISAPERSRITWKVSADKALINGWFTLNADTTSLNNPSDNYSASFSLERHSLSRFSLVSIDSVRYNSEIMELRMIPDESPRITVKNQDEFTRFEWEDTKKINFDIEISDDYAIADAAVQATVSQGSGESVKFRELRFPLEGFTPGSKNSKARGAFNLDAMGLEPGDELYFFIEAADNRSPAPNITRSSTFFVQIRDTTTYEFSLEGDLGVDIMPEYFRSQRQIIIDTEKLLSERTAITQQTFNATSNELGFDQKALRLRYGQFLGEEDESGIVVSEEAREATTESYTHDHDNEDSGGDDHSEGEDHDILDEYLHDHGDPEGATFFRVSLRAKLKQAMAEMWDSELYLRLYQPDKSLPYQYRALELIREIKNDSRIYVHRIGFEPPPIKAENRLTGKLDEVRPEIRQEINIGNDALSGIFNGLARLESEINEESRSSAETLRFLYDELSQLAIDQPEKFLAPLQKTDSLIRINGGQKRDLIVLRNDILKALPDQLTPVVSPERQPSSLTEALQREMK
ncbi:hypothetical protein [Fulvivirga sedimenti]|uniref:Tryptophan-rich sensory protein n=1 Tax=Fulvivirga sedimenti TaxID=2879465 RepID=A0A9X1HWQ9_9BACT|nr:hypothetical protein [Fulvivirga sedimenti]MCA6078790.1 hypothetical protein [Fulvivirga sedimenti]